MKRKILLSGLFCLFLNPFIQAQSVVVSGYFNAADVADEWTELLVINDDVDMRNWTIRDNGSSHSSAWQTPITFRNIAFWQHLRAGTIIVLYHRTNNSGGTPNPTDFDPSDGFLMLPLENTTYFSGGSFTSTTSMAIGGSGDIVQLRNSSATHIHALAHRSSGGPDWTALTGPKLNHSTSASSGDAIFVCPGTNINEYGTTTPLDGTTWTTKNSTNLTLGLPNHCGGSNTINSNFWRSLREPVMTSQTVASSTAPTYPTAAATFTWNTATDPVADDETIGYMIVFNTTATFGTPVDGTSYAVGAAIPGGGTVLAYVDNPNTATVSYTDYSANGTGTYCYRIYAYRYGNDNNNGNSYDVARGRAYNTTNFVSVNCQTNPLAIQLHQFYAENRNGQAFLQWQVSNESDVAYYQILHLEDDHSWSTVCKTYADLSSSYTCQEEMFRQGWHYYRLESISTSGETTVLGTKGIQFASNSESIQQLGDMVVFTMESNTNGQFSIFSNTGSLVEKGIAVSGTPLHLAFLANGVYVVRLDYQGKTAFKKIVITH